MTDPKNPTQISIELNEEIAQGTYSNLAVITHSALSTVIPNDAIIFDKETSTIVASSTAIKVPIMMFAKTHHRYEVCS